MILVSAVAAIAFAMLSFVVAIRLAPEVARGELIDWLPGYEVVRVRLLGMEFQADATSTRADAAVALGLGTAAVLAAVAAFRLDARMRTWESRSFGLIAAAAAFLALDEWLGVHETVGLNLSFLRELPAVSHPDDLIVGAYLVAALAFAWDRRRLLLGTPAARRLQLGALAVGVVAVALDLSPSEIDLLEEGLEALTALLFLAGLVAVAGHHLRPHPAARRCEQG